MMALLLCLAMGERECCEAPRYFEYIIRRVNTLTQVMLASSQESHALVFSSCFLKIKQTGACDSIGMSVKILIFLSLNTELFCNKRTGKYVMFLECSVTRFSDYRKFTEQVCRRLVSKLYFHFLDFSIHINLLTCIWTPRPRSSQ